MRHPRSSTRLFLLHLLPLLSLLPPPPLQQNPRSLPIHPSHLLISLIHRSFQLILFLLQLLRPHRPYPATILLLFIRQYEHVALIHSSPKIRAIGKPDGKAGIGSAQTSTRRAEIDEWESQKWYWSGDLCARREYNQDLMQVAKRLLVWPNIHDIKIYCKYV